jgi:hypothetical protein
MADHGMDAPIARILKRFKDWSIERLAHTEHPTFAGTDDGTVTGDQLLNWLIASIHGHPLS